MFDPTINEALQRLGGRWLVGFLQVVTALGYEFVLGAILCALYWTWDKRKTFALIAFVVCSDMINHLLKEIFQMPRPFQVAPEQVEVLDFFMRRSLAAGANVWALPARTSFGFPSGHAQVAVCFWGALAVHARRPGATLAVLAVVALIVLSRLYLGVHFLGDVLGGLAIGSLLLPIYAAIVALDRRAAWPVSGDFLLAAVFLLAVGLFFARPDVALARRAALLLGFGAGFAADRHWPGFSNAASGRERLGRVAVGLAMLGAAQLLLERGPDRLEIETLLSYPILTAALTQFLVGLAAAWVIPSFFVAVRLASSKSADRRA